MDNGMNVIEVNHAAMKIFQYSSREEMHALDFKDYLADDAWEAALEVYDRARKEGKVGCEIAHRRKNGTIFHAQIHVIVLEDEGQKIVSFIHDISEEKRLQIALKASEERYRTYIDKAPVGVVRLDKSGKIKVVNVTLCETFGYSRDEMLELTIKELIPVSEHHFVAERFGELEAKGRIEFVHDHIRKDGSSFPVRVHGILLEDGDFLGFLFDVTEQERISKAFEESEQKYRTYIENAPDGVMVLDQDHHIIEANRAICELLGYSQEELVQLNIFEIVSSDHIPHAENALARLQDDGKMRLCFEREYIGKDGRIILTRVNTTSFHGNRFIAFISDVSEEKKLQQSLIENEQKYRAYFESAPEGVFLVGPGGKIKDANRRICDMFGYSFHEFTRLTLFSIIPIEEHENIKSRMQILVSHPSELLLIEHDHIRKDGSSFPARSHASLMPNGDIIAFLSDISDEKTMQESLVQSELKYRTYIENAPEAMLVADQSMRIVDGNPALVAMLQYSMEELKSMILTDIIPKHETGNPIPQFKKLLENGYVHVECDHQRKDGTIFPVRVHAVRTPDALALGFMSDLTDERRLQQEVIESERKYRKYIDNAPVGVIICDADGVIQDANKSALNMFLYSHDDIVGVPYSRLSRRDSDIGTYFVHSGSSDGIIPSKVVRERVRKDGTSFPARVSAALMENGQVLSFYEDITEEQKMRFAVEESEARHRMYVENAPNGIAIFDENGHIIDVNPVGCSLCQYPKENLLNMNMNDIVGDACDFMGTIRALEKEGRAELEVTLHVEDDKHLRRVIRFECVRLPLNRFMTFFDDITERRESEQSLAESEKRFHDIFRVSADAIMICDTAMIIIGGNPASCELFGLNESNLIGSPLNALLSVREKKSSFEFRGPKRKEQSPITFESLMMPSMSHFECQGCHNDGRELDLDIRANPIHFQNDLHCLLSIRDVTRDKTAERERARHLASLKQAEELANLGYFEMNILNHEKFRSSGFHRILQPDAGIGLCGIDHDEFITSSSDHLERGIDSAAATCINEDSTDGDEKETQKPSFISSTLSSPFSTLNLREVSVVDLIPFVHGEDEQKVQEVIDQCLKNRFKRYGLEFRVLRCDGSVRSIEGTVECVDGGDDGDGDYVVIRGVIEDVTEKKEAERALEASEQRYRQFVNTATEGIILLSADYMCIEVNEAACNLLGLDESELTRTCIFDLVLDEVRSDFESSFMHPNKTGNIVNETTFLHSSGEEMPVFVTAIKLDEDCFLCFLYDWGDRKRVEKEKKDLEMRLNESQKMEAIGRLAGGIAHDFNNLLTSIMGNIEIMQRDADIEDAMQGNLREVREAADRAADLTRQLLAFSRKQMIQPRPLNLNVLITRMRKILARTIGEDIQLQFKPSRKPCCLKGDPNQIEQILLNLVVNARDAMPLGGDIEISTGVVTLHEDEFRRSSLVGAGSNLSCTNHIGTYDDYRTQTSIEGREKETTRPVTADVEKGRMKLTKRRASNFSLGCVKGGVATWWGH
eukprot:TRINITY_DN1425_c0_g2_i5.p1 TRINITY_DN1425_c0_g2~~TRINITY_DN1425_c0_g2_i5.p1  ORF type:complete len:1699 (+),score=478.54 TRINITY_DN1425_c0_g2_i5:557-5098(+)